MQKTACNTHQGAVANRKSQIPPPPVWLLAALLVLVTIATFWPATHCEFVNLDDNLHVTANVQVQKGLTLENIKWGLLNPVNCLWHPLTVWSHMLDCQLFGLKPWGHHLTSVLLHAVNTALVFLLLRGLTGAVWRSLLVAALFGWHPLRVESVAFVAERKDVLSGFFGLLALIAYVRYAQRRMQNAECRMKNEEATDTRHATRNTFHVSRFTFHTGFFYLLSLCFFALGLLSKPMLVTWPFVMLLLDYWPLRRMQNAECRMKNEEATDTQHAPRNTFHVSRFTFHASRFTFHPSLLLEKLPFFFLAAVMGVVTFLVQKSAGVLAVGESLSLGVRSGNAIVSYGRYLGKLVWPTGLSVCYVHPGHWPLGKVLLAAGLILGISVLGWVQRRRHPWLLMGWLWYCGTLVPVSQLVQTGAHPMADRYTYLPSLGVLILAVWGACELMQGKAEIRNPKAEGNPKGGPAGLISGFGLRISCVAGGAVIVLCLPLTRYQIGYWINSEALLRHALEVTADNYVAHKNLGIALFEKGRLDEATIQFQEAVRLRPDIAIAYYHLGIAFYQQGRVAEAIRQFQQATRLKPNYTMAYNNLGVALARSGQTEEAIRQFQEALRLQPDNAETRKNLDLVIATKVRSALPPASATNR